MRLNFFCLILLNSFICFSQNTDINILRKINADSTIFKDKSFKMLSFSVAPMAVLTPGSLILTGILRKDEGMKRNGFKSTGALLISALVGTSLKYAVNRERPFKTYNFIHRKDKVGPYSFPSNHTTFAFTTATSLSLSYPKWYVIAPAYLWAAGAAYSRMYLGVHYPSDVFGGIVIGVGSSLLAWQIDKWMSH